VGDDPASLLPTEVTLYPVAPNHNSLLFASLG
jgi:hypothetical protein